MNTNDSNSKEVYSPAAKKPYQKPAFRHEEVFVTTALQCGKQPSQAQCQQIVNTSAS